MPVLWEKNRDSHFFFFSKNCVALRRIYFTHPSGEECLKKKSGFSPAYTANPLFFWLHLNVKTHFTLKPQPIRSVYRSQAKNKSSFSCLFLILEVILCAKLPPSKSFLRQSVFALINSALAVTVRRRPGGGGVCVCAFVYPSWLRRGTVGRNKSRGKLASGRRTRIHSLCLSLCA